MHDLTETRSQPPGSTITMPIFIDLKTEVQGA